MRERKRHSLEALRGKQRERGRDGRMKRRGVSAGNTMEAVIFDGGHLIPRSQQEAIGSDYCLLPVCCHTHPLTLRGCVHMALNTYLYCNLKTTVSTSTYV